MGKLRKNELEINTRRGTVEDARLSLTEAKPMFLRDIRLLSPDTQRWHRANLTAFEKKLDTSTA